MEIPVYNVNSVDPDQTPRSVASDLGLQYLPMALRKRACSKILKISPPKTESFQIKILIFFIFLLNTEIVSTRGESNEYPQSMLLSRNKIMCTPGNPRVTI